ncbi:MAG: SDR family oxidoreductase [Armatimonadetes bacterium]|nr:SDR family oxidoreductase [Armatimonadota bacterium]
MPPPLLPDPSEFAGRVALVTGGSAGLGEHLTRSLVSLGCHVVFCGRRDELGLPLAAELGELAHWVRCDLAEPEQIRALVSVAAELTGAVDYLVNNAAQDPRIGFEAMTVEQFDQLVATNLRSYFVTTQAALPYLRRGEGRAVVNIGSTNYLFGNAGMTGYGAAKAGIYGFTRSLARELGPEGIRVNLLSPGWIMTERQLAEHVSPADQESLIEHQCVKALMTPAHVTPVTLWLLSAAAQAMSGQQVVVDGGYWLL